MKLILRVSFKDWVLNSFTNFVNIKSDEKFRKLKYFYEIKGNQKYFSEK